MRNGGGYDHIGGLRGYYDGGRGRFLGRCGGVVRYGARDVGVGLREAH
jgi:hypothetical protein